MAATADGKTSMRPHCRDWISAVVVLEAMRKLMVQFGSARKRSCVDARLFSRRKVNHGQTVRDLRQNAAVRTSRQPREEPGQPEVPAQPPDGPRDGRGQDLPRARLHPVPSYLFGLGTAHAPSPRPFPLWGEGQVVDLAQAAEVVAQGVPDPLLRLG